MTHISEAFAIQSTATNQTHRIEMIWGARILDEGFTAIPNILLRNYRKLGIDHNEWGLLCVLLSYKHDARDPYPEQETLAQNLRLSVRQVRNLTTSLQSKGFLIVGRRRNQRTQKYGSLVYNLSPLMNKLLEMSDNPLDTAAPENDQPAEINRPNPPEVLFPLKRITLKDKDTTTTTIKVNEEGNNRKNAVSRDKNTPEKIVQRIQKKIGTHLQKTKDTTEESWVHWLSLVHQTTEKTQAHDHTEESTHSVPDGNLSGCIDDQIGRKESHLQPIQSFQEGTVSTTTDSASENVANLLSKSSFDGDIEAHRKIAMVMRQNMVQTYTQTAKDIQTIHAFLVSGVPLDWILSETKRQFEMRPDAREKARCFGYMAEILKDSWQCELAKKAPAEPIDFESYRKKTSRRQRKQANRSATKTAHTAPVQDERYENFYRLFPEGDHKINRIATDSTHDARYEAFHKLFPEA